MTALAVALGAALGAVVRYLIDSALRARVGGSFPWGTLAVNAIGSLLLGAALTSARNGQWPDAATAAISTGFCGALTTYSTFSLETVLLAEDGARLRAGLNILANLVLGFGAFWLGTCLG